MKPKEELITRIPGYLTGPKGQKWRVPRNPRKCLALPVPWLQAALFFPQPSLPLSLGILPLSWPQYTYDSQMSFIVHSAPSWTSAPRESTCAKLNSPVPLLTWSFIQYIFFYWAPTMCWDELLKFPLLLLCISNLEHGNQSCEPWFPPSHPLNPIRHQV